MNKNALHFPELLESLVALDTEMQRDRAGAKIIEGWEQILLVFFTLFSPCPPFTYSSPFCSFVFRVRFSCGLFLFSFLLFVSLCPLLCYLCFSYPLDSYPFYFYFSSSRLWVVIFIFYLHLQQPIVQIKDVASDRGWQPVKYIIAVPRTTPCNMVALLHLLVAVGNDHTTYNLEFL